MGSPLENLQSGISQSREDNSVEAIRNFRVSDDRLPLTFRLLSVKGLPPWANTSCVRITDIVQVIRGMLVFHFHKRQLPTTEY